MTTFAERPTIAAPRQGVQKTSLGSQFVKTITSTDHKRIGYLYLVTSFVWFLIGGVLALFIRAELTRPGMQFMSVEQYNQVFTMHGTIMLLMFATPLFVGFANVIMPLQIGAADVAFPRLNMLSYWLYLFGSIQATIGFLTPGGAASFGWTAYAPLSNSTYSPGIGGDLWIMGLAISGLGTILGGVNFITTIFTMRAPGMTMFRMSIFSWNVLLTSILVLNQIDYSARISSTRPMEVRCSGSISSGSLGTPRFISWRYRSLESQLKSCRSLAVNQSLVTRVLSRLLSQFRLFQLQCGRTTCSQAAKCSCPSSHL
jgi:hypothetical protein